MKILVIASFCFLSYISCKDIKLIEWENFKITFNKTYPNEEEENFRKEIFLTNVAAINEHNRKFRQGLVSYTVKINQLTDKTLKELFPSLKSNQISSPKISRQIEKTKVPESIDWRDYGVIPPIVNQGYCLSCWAFAVVSAVEAHVGIHLGKKNVTLSEQNLVDCVYPSFDCHEEMERQALEHSYQYIINNNGIDTKQSYPYEDSSGHECRYNPENVGATIKNYATITEADEDELKTVVGTVGPVSVIITADFTFTVYQSGVYYKENCVNTKEPYNHAVTVIGYGNEDGKDYWLVRNEWGELFGDSGYIKMARNRDNNCGIASYASYPIVEDSKVKV